MKTLFIDSKSERTNDLLCKAMLSQINKNGIFSCGRHGFVAEKRLEGIQEDYDCGLITDNERFSLMMEIYVDLFDHVQIMAVDDPSKVDPSSSILIGPSKACLANWAEENRKNVQDFLEGIVEPENNKTNSILDEDYNQWKIEEAEQIMSFDDLPF
jgi:hypothetical protein